MYYTILSTLFTALIVMIKDPSSSKKRSLSFVDLLRSVFCSRRPGLMATFLAYPSSAVSDVSDCHSCDKKFGPGFPRGTALQIASELGRLGDEFEAEFGQNISAEKDSSEASIWDVVLRIVGLV
ncbi:hypothetical protein L596_025304 [Steinernema carpocapsae]|uniref:Uncharacterized protein n=1 Tax=Steinernema carpocapsae TaxID=34508 RepID=A0A4V5ZYS2_STECR|nr:hypothetical protein L596_025304 [Steinernema carpocapsae]